MNLAFHGGDATEGDWREWERKQKMETTPDNGQEDSLEYQPPPQSPERLRLEAVKAIIHSDGYGYVLLRFKQNNGPILTPGPQPMDISSNLPPHIGLEITLKAAAYMRGQVEQEVKRQPSKRFQSPP